MSIRSVKKIDNLVPVKNAMISVSDKSYLSILVQGLTEVSQYTGLPETEGGLVKTLHHKLFLGYLTETYCEAHQKDLKREHAVPIDLVVINLYPFKNVVKKDDITIEEARGNIDVGGPSALRAAAKNWHRVMTLSNPNAYFEFLEKLKENSGCTNLSTRFQAFKETFFILSSYDRAIFNFFDGISPEMTKSMGEYEIH